MATILAQPLVLATTPDLATQVADLQTRLAKIESVLQVGPAGDVTLKSISSVRISSGADLSTKAGTSMTITASSDMSIKSGSTMSVQASGSMTMKGSVVNIN